MKDGTIGVLVVEDDEDFCYLIRNTLGREPGMRILGTTANGEEAVALAKKWEPDIVLMDLNLSLAELDGIEAARKIRLTTYAKVILVTAFESQHIVTDACKRSFASAYVFKSQFSILTETVRKTAEGPTPQEMLIFSLIQADLSPAERSVFSIMLGGRCTSTVLAKNDCQSKDCAPKKAGAKKPKGIGTSFFKECRSKIKRMSAAGLCTCCGRFDKSTGKLAGY